MALKAVVDSLDNVPEEFHALYVEKDGKFVLDIEGVESHPGVTALKNALERVKQSKIEITGKLTAAESRLREIPEDFDPAEFERLRTFEAEHKGDDKGDAGKEAVQRLTALHEQKIKGIETKHAAEIKTRDERIAKLDSDVKRIIVDDGLTKELVAAGVGKEYLKAAKALLREGTKVEEEDGEYTAVYQAEEGPIELSKYVAEWVQGDEGKVFIPKPSGGDAPGGDLRKAADNPWSSRDGRKPNLTKQQEMIQKDPEKARNLARAAGATPTW